MPNRQGATSQFICAPGTHGHNTYTEQCRNPKSVNKQKYALTHDATIANESHGDTQIYLESRPWVVRFTEENISLNHLIVTSQNMHRFTEGILSTPVATQLNFMRDHREATCNPAVKWFGHHR